MDETTEQQGDADVDSGGGDRVFDISADSISPVGPASESSPRSQPAPASGTGSKSASSAGSSTMDNPDRNASMRKQAEEALDAELSSGEPIGKAPFAKTPPTPPPAPAPIPQVRTPLASALNNVISQAAPGTPLTFGGDLVPPPPPGEKPAQPVPSNEPAEPAAKPEPAPVPLAPLAPEPASASSPAPASTPAPAPAPEPAPEISKPFVSTRTEPSIASEIIAKAAETIESAPKSSRLPSTSNYNPPPQNPTPNPNLNPTPNPAPVADRPKFGSAAFNSDEIFKDKWITGQPRIPDGKAVEVSPLYPKKPDQEIPPTAPETAPLQGKPPYSVQDPNIKPIRTYESDVAEVLAHTRTSTASIALAESRKRENEERISNNVEPQPLGPAADEEKPQRPPSTKRGSKLALVILSIVFVIAGIGAGFYLYLKSPVAPAPNLPSQGSQSTASVVPVDSFTIIPIDSTGPEEILARIRQEASTSREPGKIKEYIFSLNVISPTDCGGGSSPSDCAPSQSGGQSQRKIRVSSVDMMSFMDIEAPDVLIRSLAVPWMLGTYVNPAGEKDAFVILTTNFFQNAFAGMLQWEKLLPDDLKSFIFTDPPAVIRGKFEDQIVDNRDVRAFRSENGEVLFMYSIIDSSKLIITGKAATLSEILKRLEQQAFVR